ncbi:TAXI family TRAP transporter solute-binding subunit [Geomicrobium sp. JCM 19038]|uniref:TAXI family TRAP transporter solute-binding subunit n=1 Tax=Geomicrobium sp. JCM 19038 TaxID=1460635 RepID=UPI0005AA880A|nr:TAXI family TRAP transporter solute-binding subunit [Geomicrobium sp. JCM 19038]
MSKSYLFLTGIVGLVLLTSCDNPRASPETLAVGAAGEQIPEAMVWSVYDINSGGYAEAAAVANEMTEEYGTQIRMLPSSSGVGRMMPLYNRDALLGKIGDEVKFSFEATEEFFDLGWGPQPMRTIWAPISPFGFAVRENSPIQSIEEVEGLRVPMIPGNNSVNIKTEAILGFGGLSREDVEIVDINSYGGQGEALIQGEIDVASINPLAGGMFEADSLGGIRWLQMPGDDEERWAQSAEVADWFFPRELDNGAGMDGMNEVLGHGYVFATYEEASTEAIYTFTKALIEQYENYENATSNMWTYHPDEVIMNPADTGVPFHEGSIQFFEEAGLWSEEYEEANNNLLEREEQLNEIWEEAKQVAEAENLTIEEHEQLWLEMKAVLDE